MSYCMRRITIGTSKTQTVFDINTDLEISGLCHIDGFGFLFICRKNHCILHSDDNGRLNIHWMGHINQKGSDDGTNPFFNYPSSLCYYDNMKMVFLIELGGTKIRPIEIKNKYCGSIPLSNSLNKYYSKTELIDLIETYCDVDKYGSIYWTARDLNRCFKMSRESNTADVYLGNGHSGFSVSNNLHACLLSHPSGIKCVDGSMYISDSGNHCIREAKNGLVIFVAGNPLNNNILDFPTQIKYNDNILYILDGQHIKYLSLKNKDIGIIYSSSNIVAMELNKKDLYVLENS